MNFGLRETAHASLAFLLHRTGLQTVLLNRAEALLLMYHRVLPEGAPSDWPLKSLVVDTYAFEEQIEWLVSRFEMRTAIDAPCDSVPGQRPIAVVTFDDGYCDNYLYAAPILKRFGVPATFFVPSDFINQSKRLWFDVASRAWQRSGSRDGCQPLAVWMSALKRMTVRERIEALANVTSGEDWVSSDRDAAMTWTQLQELQANGHEVGCHSRSHPILTNLSQDELHTELMGSVDALRAKGLFAQGIAYPNGDYNGRVIHCAQAANLRYGVTTRNCWHRNHSLPFEVSRVDVNPALVRRWSDDPASGFATELAWRAMNMSRS